MDRINDSHPSTYELPEEIWALLSQPPQSHAAAEAEAPTQTHNHDHTTAGYDASQVSRVPQPSPAYVVPLTAYGTTLLSHESFEPQRFHADPYQPYETPIQHEWPQVGFPHAGQAEGFLEAVNFNFDPIDYSSLQHSFHQPTFESSSLLQAPNTW